MCEESAGGVGSLSMQGRCDKHLFDPAEDRCGTCGGEFCAECLVYAFGPKKPPFCIPCAVVAAGIRKTAAGATLTRRDAKRLERERRSALKQARKARAAADRQAAAMDGTGAAADTEPDTLEAQYELPQVAAFDTPDRFASFAESTAISDDSVPAAS